MMKTLEEVLKENQGKILNMKIDERLILKTQECESYKSLNILNAMLAQVFLFHLVYDRKLNVFFVVQPCEADELLIRCIPLTNLEAIRITEKINQFLDLSKPLINRLKE